MRVLISRLSSLGDVVCTLPTAGAIKGQWPDAVITWVVDKRFRGIVDCCAHVDQVVERPSLGDVARLGKFDAALDMQGLLKSAVIVGFSKAKAKLGYHWQREGSGLFSGRVLPDPSSIHVVDQYVDVARALGASSAHRAEFGLAPKGDAVETVREKLTKRGWKDGPLVVMNAGAGWATKRWGAQRFAELADKLDEGLCTTVFLGAPSDRHILDEVKQHGAKRALSMVGETSVTELVALVSLAAAHVGGDTGSTHIAAALGTPAIGIYTLTRPERSCPYGQIGRCFTGDPSVQVVHAKVQEALC